MAEFLTEGIRPGGLTEENQVRILICHILKNAGAPLSFDQLTEAVLVDELVNYFEFANALSALEELSFVDCLQSGESETHYALTQKGIEVLTELQRDLPASIRERSAEYAKGLLLRERLEKENKATIDKAEGGYTVHMVVTDIGAPLMELRLFMPTFEQAQSAKARFRADPAGAYAKVLGTIVDF